MSPITAGSEDLSRWPTNMDTASIAAGMLQDARIEEEDRELVRRMASRDSAALDAFYERYNRLAFSLVMRVVNNRADAEDVLMDVFWQVWQQSQRYDSTRGKPVAWLLTIARTRAIDSVRSSVRQQTKNDQFENQNVPQASTNEFAGFDAERRTAVQDALQSLSENQRIPLELAYFQGMSHTEIADSLGQPLGTVKDRIRTGMAHLRKRLKAYI
jgi:RNA polymerase sigma-70 factor, ECF subfamily